MSACKSTDEDVGIFSVATSAIWLGCLSVGILGFLLPYVRPQPPLQNLPPVRAELLNVEIKQSRVTQPQSHARSPQQTIEPTPTPSLTEVVAPSPAIVFALPVAVPVVQHLTYGEGEGQQPGPEYPAESIIARQQGTVVVRFVVDENGRVQSVEIVKPSPWPLLNQAAVRAVRDSWRFTAGEMRSYEVSIEFQLRQRSQ